MQISLLATARLIVMLRRIWKTQQELVAIEREKLKLEKEKMSMLYPQWLRAGQQLPPKQGKATEFGVADVDELNKRYREMFPDYE